MHSLLHSLSLTHTQTHTPAHLHTHARAQAKQQSLLQLSSQAAGDRTSDVVRPPRRAHPVALARSLALPPTRSGISHALAHSWQARCSMMTRTMSTHTRCHSCKLEIRFTICLLHASQCNTKSMDTHLQASVTLALATPTTDSLCFHFQICLNFPKLTVLTATSNIDIFEEYLVFFIYNTNEKKSIHEKIHSVFFFS